MSQTTLARPVRNQAAIANQKLTLVVDLDERGSFRAHVENANGECLFDFSNEDESGWPSEDGLWLVVDGYMRHNRDADGLLEYLQSMGIAEPGATMSVQG